MARWKKPKVKDLVDKATQPLKQATSKVGSLLGGNVPKGNVANSNEMFSGQKMKAGEWKNAFKRRPQMSRPKMPKNPQRGMTQAALPNAAREVTDRGWESFAPDVKKLGKDPLAWGREKGWKAQSGFKTMMGNDPKRGQGSSGGTPPEAQPVDSGTMQTQGEFNPFPFDWAKRMETIDPKTGMVKDQYKVDVMKERGESPWLKQQYSKQALEEQQAGEGATKMAEMNRAQASSGLAQTTGASAGAMERLQSQANRDAIAERQKIQQQGMLQRQGLRIGDTERQIGAERENIGTSLGQIDKTYGAAQDLFGQKAGAYAGEQLAKQIDGQTTNDIWDRLGKKNPFRQGNQQEGLGNPKDALTPGGAGTWGVPLDPRGGGFGIPGLSPKGTPYYGGKTNTYGSYDVGSENDPYYRGQR